MDRLFELTLFEEELKKWYVKHGELMPWNIFLLKERQLRVASAEAENPIRAIDPCCQEYENAIYDRNYGFIDLKNISLLLSNKYILMLKQPRYFPLVPFSNSGYEISYVYCGECRISLANGNTKENWKIKKGDFFFVPTGFKESFYISNDETIVLNFILYPNVLQQMMMNSHLGVLSASLCMTSHPNSPQRRTHGCVL